MTLPTYLRNSGKKLQIESREGFAQLFSATSTDLFDRQFQSADTAIRAVAPNIAQGALSNVHGSWYEWILGHAFWNHFLANDRSFLVVKLPNVTSFDVADLFEEKLRDYIIDLRRKVLEASQVELVTSNPDFVIYDVTDSDLESLRDGQSIDEYSVRSSEFLDELYTQLIGKCNFKTIVGFLSVKTSFRPDRRLQIPHEGSLMKALYAHLVTREWELNPRGIRYYAVACKVGDPDRRALKTVATHSITTVTDLPKAAVDEVFSVNSNRELQSLIEAVLTQSS